MGKTVLLDTNFIVGLFNSADRLHENSSFIFKLLWKERSRIIMIIPPLCIYEVIVVLRRAGVDINTIQQKIMKLLMIDNMIVHTVNELSALRQSNGLLVGTTVKTNDFIIASTGMDYSALIITFDKGLRDRLKPLYEDVYYCTRASGAATNEMAPFLSKLYSA